MRLSRKGRSKAPFYHIVIADARSPRDGKFIEKIGTYNPMTKPATIDIDRDAAYNWLVKGAQPTDTVKAILRFKGVYYKKHLMRGLKKGALTQEQVDTLLADWIGAKESKIQLRVEKTKAELDAFRKAVSGEAKKSKAPVADERTKETAEAIFHAGEESAVEEAAENVAGAIAEATEANVEESTENVEDVVAEAAAEEAEETVLASEEPKAEESSEAGDQPAAEESSNEDA